MNHQNFVIASALALASAPISLAGIVNEYVPVWRGGPNTTYSGWDVFTSPYAGPNAADEPGSSPATLFNFGAGSVITGSGNIYGFHSPLLILINGGVLNAPSLPLEVVLNIGTGGSLLDTSSVTFSAITSTGLVSFSPTTSELRYDLEIPGFGSTQTRAFTWDLSSLSVPAYGYQIGFRSVEDHMALTGVAVDIRYVPTPAAGVVILAGLTRSRRRR